MESSINGFAIDFYFEAGTGNSPPEKSVDRKEAVEKFPTLQTHLPTRSPRPPGQFKRSIALKQIVHLLDGIQYRVQSLHACFFTTNIRFTQKELK